jgi:hypothetical protein
MQSTNPEAFVLMDLNDLGAFSTDERWARACSVKRGFPVLSVQAPLAYTRETGIFELDAFAVCALGKCLRTSRGHRGLRVPPDVHRAVSRNGIPLRGTRMKQRGRLKRVDIGLMRRHTGIV